MVRQEDKIEIETLIKKGIYSRVTERKSKKSSSLPHPQVKKNITSF
jgi:hypothetical protein